MNTSDVSVTLTTLFGELVNGAKGPAFVLNSGDKGLLSSLDELTPEQASTPSTRSSTVAAHVAHLRYGISLMNRWALGENPFTDADWATAWTKTTVTETEWSTLRSELREECEAWLTTLSAPRDVQEIELNGMLASIVHLGYHLGAMRQMAAEMRGPKGG